MERAQAIEVLRRHEAELRRRGVLHLALFGSVARGEGRSDSDIDVMLDLDPAVQVSVFDYADIVGFIEGLFPTRVDVVNGRMLRSHVRPGALRDGVDAF